MRDYLKLLKFVRPYYGLFAIAIVCMGFSAIFDGVSLAMIVPLAVYAETTMAGTRTPKRLKRKE